MLPSTCRARYLTLLITNFSCFVLKHLNSWFFLELPVASTSNYFLTDFLVCITAFITAYELGHKFPSLIFFLDTLCLKADKSLQVLFILFFHSPLLFLTFAIMATSTRNTLFIPVTMMSFHLLSNTKLKSNLLFWSQYKSKNQTEG